MKVRLLSEIIIGDDLLLAGQLLILSDAHGSELVSLGVAEIIDENERGGFAVPMVIVEEP
jgi:hypothetical protein